MSLAIARQAVRAWPRHPLASRAHVRHLRRQFVAKVSLLGDRYLLARAQFVARKGAP